MGVVYEARDSHLDRTIALKLLPADALANPARRQRFVQEAKAASALNHPHIVTIYDISSDDGTDYIAMEFIRGRTLEQLLSTGKLPLAEALKYATQLADALAAAHAAGIVHRDLKPGNIMITERGDVKVLDFGLAKLADSPSVSDQDVTRTQRVHTQVGTVMGSPPYMSPEQAEGRPVDARSDIFSFGSVLYEMLTGTRAFQGTNHTATMAAILKDEPAAVTSVVPEIPAEVERIVARCLRKDVERRSQSMAEIRAALQELQDQAQSGPHARASAAPAARRLSGWHWGLAAMVVAAAAGAFVMFRPSPAVEPLQATVLTSFVERQGLPSLSPDGNQFAFTWNGDVPEGKLHVYISLVGKGTPLRLTPEDDVAFAPSWSPDGQSIAFWRGEGSQTDLQVMPALGGPGRRIAVSPAGTNGAACWSPDGKWLLWSAPHANHPRGTLHAALSSGADGHPLFDPSPSITWSDAYPALSPDGRLLVFVRSSGDYDNDLYVAGFQEGRLTGAPRRITTDSGVKFTPQWTKDGAEVIYIQRSVGEEGHLSRVRVSGGEPVRIGGVGENASVLTLAAKANRLVYASTSINFDIQRVDLTAAKAKPERFLSSTRFDGEPSYSPDGKRIAFGSNRGGVRQIWVADANGANPAPVTTFASGVAGSPKWSPDGQTIAFDARPAGNSDIYTVPAAGGPVKRLTDSTAEDHVPSWSPDGKWIYFGSAQAGGHEVFRMHPDGGAVQQITRGGGLYGQVSPDGQFLYYSMLRNGLWKMAAEGGKPEQVLPDVALGRQYGFLVRPEGIYAVAAGTAATGFPVVRHPLKAGKPQTLAALPRMPDLFIDLSPDGRWLIFSASNPPVSEIMLVDNFR